MKRPIDPAEPAGVVLAVRLTPRSGRDGVDGVGVDSAGRLFIKARVRAVPEGGKANAALCAVLARQFGRPPGSVSITRGQTSRLKQVLLAGADAADIQSKIALLPKD